MDEINSDSVNQGNSLDALLALARGSEEASGAMAEAKKAGMSTTQIANAFNVTSRAVRKALSAKNKGHRDK
jgi:DNA-binding phage protein